MFNLLKVTGKLREIPDNYAVYSLSVIDSRIEYIGVCKINDIFLTPDARENALYALYFPPESDATIEILFTDLSRSNCMIHASRLVIQHKPIMNVKGFVYGRGNAPIVCNETGEVFQTLEDVSRMHNINAAALCQHLHNRPGYKSLKGKTYRRGNTPDEAEKYYQSTKMRKIKNVTTGEIFESSSAVAKKYGVTSGAVCRHLKGKFATLKGQIFTYM